MMKQRKTHRSYALPGFTIAELLVVLALTSVSVTLSYATLTYVQKLFQVYKTQNRFLNEYTELKKRLDHEALVCERVLEEQENCFDFRGDTSVSRLQLGERLILLTRHGRCDTFHLPVKNIHRVYEPLLNPDWQDRLISHLWFETEFSRQSFRMVFEKEYPASLKMLLNTGGIDHGSY